MAIPLPPAPNAAAPGDFVWVDWYNKLQKILSVTGSIAWNLIDFKSSKLTDIVNRDHNDLLAIQGGTATEHYHLNNAQYVIATQAASATVSGYLTSADWSTFNGKQPAGAYLTAVTSNSPLTGAGTAASHLSMPAATTSVNGYLTSTDWTTFNNKGSGTVTSVTGTAPVVSSGGATPAISMAAATTSVSGYLTSTDWNTFNGKQAAGTYVTSLTVTGANGFAGSFTSGATPALTVSTSITGLLKGNGTAISAAVANTDYVPLSTVLTKTADYTIANTDMWIINNKTGSALTLTFPAASSWIGRAITVKNMQAQLVNSASSNIVPIDSTTAGTAILLGVVGNWAKLVSDGTNWVIMQAASNNNLLLE